MSSRYKPVYIDESQRASLLYCTFITSGSDLEKPNTTRQQDQLAQDGTRQVIYRLIDTGYWSNWRESFAASPEVSDHSRKTAREFGSEAISKDITYDGEYLHKPIKYWLGFFSPGVRVSSALRATVDDMTKKIDAHHMSTRTLYESCNLRDTFELHFPSRTGYMKAEPPASNLGVIPPEFDEDRYNSYIEEKWGDYIVGDMSAIQQPDVQTILIPVIYKPRDVDSAVEEVGTGRRE